MKKILIIFLLTLLGNNYSWSQSNQNVIKIPLSEPHKIGLLKLDIIDGQITIKGTDRSDVQVELNEEKAGKHKSKNNLYEISRAVRDVDISESHNTITIEGSSSRTNYTIEVPSTFNLSLYTNQKNSHISVIGVTGEIDVEAYWGNVELENVGGAIIAETYYGKIEAEIIEVYENKPMAFTSYYGDIEVMYPYNSNCYVKMRSVKGKVYTDFELNYKPESSANENKIKVGGWINAKNGTGGKRYLFTNYFGDIVVMKSKE